MTVLPITDVLDPLIGALKSRGVAVLQAPPGAGKTTQVPLALLEAGAFSGKLIMLEPRRLAVRAAADRMAALLGEDVGQTVGYRMRGDTRLGKTTRIEIVTEGILTRMLQSDPALSGIGAVVFDEFHERSLNGDLGLALTWEARSALREDLKVLVMSATLDAAPVATLLDAPVITSDGRSFPVETIWLDRPLRKDARFETSVANLIEQAAAQTDGSILVFLPGAGEIKRVSNTLNVAGADIRPLYGALPFTDQRAAIAPGAGRKIVLATSIAETSLTIEGINVVIDAGKARRARFDPGAGMTRLVTEPVSRAEADQRRGRAGRIMAGTCYRMWSHAQEGALPAFPPAEIEAADLTGLALELALWGASPQDLAFLDPPPAVAYTEAQALLRDLRALDHHNRITAHGKTLAKIPLHPRLAHMLSHSDAGAADIAALLSLRSGDRDRDLATRLATARQSRQHRAEAKRLSRFANGPARISGEMAALAYPDRIGLRRKGDDPRYVLSGGKGAVMHGGDPLANQRLIVALDLDGDTREAGIRLATALDEDDLRGLYADQISWQNECRWSRRDRRVLTRSQERFGALVLADRAWPDAPVDMVVCALMDGVRDLGLGCLDWSKPARLLRARVQMLSGTPDIPDWSDDALLGGLDTWLAPFARHARDMSGLGKIALAPALRATLGYAAQTTLDRLAPAQFTSPLGSKIAIDYSDETPAIEVRLQEMFGLTAHPMIGRVPLKLTLLSPARRPIQITTDLPGFWATSYADLRKDMRGQYPKHPWPEDPTQANPTLRAKPRH